MVELELERLMKYDFSIGKEAFRDALLQRCLAVLCMGDEGVPLDDASLEQLAAAGDILPADFSSLEPRFPLGDNGSGNRLT